MEEAGTTTGAKGSAGASGGTPRIRVRTFDRLTVRLAAGILLIVVVPLGVGLYALSSQHYDRSIEARKRAAEVQNKVLETALRHQMLDPDRVLLGRVMEDIGTQPEVERAMILNHEGVVRISSDPSLLDERLPLESASCQVCHSKDPSERDHFAVLEHEDGDVLRSVQPIENRQECHACHAPEDRLNGILIVDLSLEGFHAALNRELARISAGAGLLAVLILGGVGFLVRRLILRRLRRVTRAARHVAAGRLEVRAPVEGDDVIAGLAQDFNRMADSVTHLLDEVRDQESQLTSVMNSLDDGLVVLDRQARVVASNHAFGRRYGVLPEVLRARSCEGIHGGALPCCATAQDCLAARCVSTKEVQRAVIPVPGADGGPGQVEEVYASPVFDDKGEVVQVVELWRNITGRIQEQERLSEIERLVSLGALASGFSHEVNTPLASMLTSAEGILARVEEGTLDPEAVGDSAEVIREQVLRCRRITQQFLRFSRGIPPSIEPLDLGQEVAAVVALVAPTARESGVSVHLDQHGALPAVQANMEVVQHVLLNLLMNAIQSCRSEDDVHVGFRVQDQVHVTVRDTGSGIAPEDRELLFAPFRSRKPQGTGLGLFLARSFLRRFGGDVDLVWSRPGEGSCFEARLVIIHGKEGS